MNTTPNAAQAVRSLDQAFGEQIVMGMGTLSEPAQAREALEAGARFLVSPIYEAKLGNAMVATSLPVMIGGLTPTEVYQAHRMGSDVVKIFPGASAANIYW